MAASTSINVHLERVIIDEAIHRAGPEAVRAALAAQLPGLLAASGVREFHPAATATAESLAENIPPSFHSV
jgi:hypothetical protein